MCCCWLQRSKISTFLKISLTHHNKNPKYDSPGQKMLIIDLPLPAYYQEKVINSFGKFSKKKFLEAIATTWP